MYASSVGLDRQEISSNGSLILAHNMCSSERDVSLIVTDRNRTYTELTDGIL